MKKLLLLILVSSSAALFAQQKTFDYAYMNKMSISVYSFADKKEYPVVSSAMNPAISPDGKKLAYTAMLKNGDRVINVIDLSTKKKIKLNANSNNCYGPVWSPDGKHIAYSVFENSKSNWSIAVIDTNNMKPVIITGKIKEGFMPAWCNGGKSIAIHDMDKLYVIDMAGNINKTIDLKDFKLSMGTSSADGFVFTADNKHIIYTTSVDEGGRDDGPPSALFCYDAATKTIKRLSPKGYMANQFAVKGNSVLFSGSKLNARVSNIYSVNIDGSNFKVLIPGRHDISVR